MRVLYHGEGGWSSLNREKCDDSLNEEGDDAHSADDDEEPKQGNNGSDVDLISFHVYMIAQGEGDCKGKQGETCGRKCLSTQYLRRSRRGRV